MKLETFRAANALETEIQELQKAKVNARAGIFLTGGFNLGTLLGELATTLVNAAVDALTDLISAKEKQLEDLLQGDSIPVIENPQQ